VASVHRHSSNRSKFWYASFRGSDGRWSLRSTKCTDRDRAIEIALRFEREASGLSLFEDVESASIAQAKLLQVTRKAQSGEFDEHVAREYLNGLLSLCRKNSLDSASITHHFNRWLEEKKRTASTGTYDSYAHTVKNFLSFLGPKAMRGLASLTPTEIDRFMTIELSEGKSAGTVKLAIKTLSAALNRARMLGIILTNPAEAVEIGETDSLGKLPFSAAQVLALWTAADDDWKGMTHLGFYLGVRIGDASRMKWIHVDLEQGTITFRQQKSKRGAPAKPVTTVLMPELLEYLRVRKPSSAQTGDFIFPHLAKRRVGGKTGLSQVFMELIQKAGIENQPIDRAIKGKGRKFYPFGYHSFRHTAIAIMENLEIPEEIRRLHVGHTSDAHAHYSHRQIGSIRAALKNYPAINPKPKN